MHILFLSDNFPPESNAPASRLHEHARHWVRAGHTVTVITCAPNFPEGKLYPGYRNRWYGVETIDGIRVVRVKTLITANEGFVMRTLDYASFGIAAAIAGLFQRAPDVIVATSPQFFCALGGWFLAFLRRRPFVLEVRDLWPASIVAVGAMADSPVIRSLTALELFLYRRATAIVTVTEAMKADIAARGIDAEKIGVVVNGIEPGLFAPRPRDDALALEHGLEGKFVVGYVGTHGMAHALDKVLDAAERLRDRTDIVFLFVGSGAKRAELVADARRRDLENVRFLPRQAKEDMPRIWSLCNLALVSLRDTAVFATVIPSKIFEAMGMGVPILLAVPEGEATRLVRDCAAGVAVPPERPDLLAKRIVELDNDAPALRELSAAGAKNASRFHRDRLAGRMAGRMESVLENAG